MFLSRVSFFPWTFDSRRWFLLWPFCCCVFAFLLLCFFRSTSLSLLCCCSVFSSLCPSLYSLAAALLLLCCFAAALLLFTLYNSAALYRLFLLVFRWTSKGVVTSKEKWRPVTVVCLYHINPAATINGYLPAMIAGSAGESRFPRLNENGPATSSSEFSRGPGLGKSGGRRGHS